MKSSLKIRNYFIPCAIFLLAGAFLVSCSEDDKEVAKEKSLEEVEFSLAKKDKVIEVPSALADSDNAYAKQVVGYIVEANKMSNNFSNLQPPSNAIKSTTPVLTGNGRLEEKEYLVYTWESQGFNVSYQVSQDDNYYYFEVFTQQDEGKHIKIIDAKEHKTDKSGSMEISVGTQVLAKYEWHYDVNEKFNLTADILNFKYVINIQADASGDVSYYYQGELWWEMTWAADGSGTWKYYVDGALHSEGSWT